MLDLSEKLTVTPVFPEFRLAAAPVLLFQLFENQWGGRKSCSKQAKRFKVVSNTVVRKEPSMSQPPLATLLLVVATETAMRLRLDWLEKAGYSVSPACSLKDVEQACRKYVFDLVLMADGVEPKMKKAIAFAVRHYLPETPILQMGRIRPDIDGNSFVTVDSREGVLQSVSKILRHDPIRPAAL
jgi:hypothetical protein